MMNFGKFIAPYARRIRNMLARGGLLMTDDSGPCQHVQIDVDGGAAMGLLEHLQPYGLTSRAHPGAEHFSVFLEGDRANGVTLVIADRRYRMLGLAEGEVALCDDLGQSVYLTRGGIVVNGGGNPIKFTNASKVRIEAPLEVTGDIKDNCDTSGKTMAAMRSTYNSHTHTDPQGGVTGTPTPTM